MTFVAVFYFTTTDDELKNYLDETAQRWGAVQLADTAWGFREPTKRIDDFLHLLWNNREALYHRAVLYGGGRMLR